MESIGARTTTKIQKGFTTRGVQIMRQFLAPKRRVVMHSQGKFSRLLLVRAEMTGRIHCWRRVHDCFVQSRQSETTIVEIAKPISQVVFSCGRQKGRPDSRR